MHAALTLKVAVCIGPSNDAGSTLDPRFVATLALQKFDLEAVLLAPPNVHAQEDFSPVLRLSSAGSGVNSKKSIPLVVRPRKFELEVELSEVRLDPLHERPEFFRTLTLRQEFLPDLDLFRIRVESLGGLQPTFDHAPLLQQRRALRRVVPEAGDLHVVIDRRQVILQLSVVKDTPEERGDARSDDQGSVGIPGS